MQEPEPTDTEPITFSFGKNWESFVEPHLSQERVDMAERPLLDFLHVPDLKGKVFLDAGSGSGIHSLAALQAGAERVVSFDVDDVAVATTKRVRAQCGSPSRWEVRHGSVLDVEFLRTLDPADVVCSWGVLHHTGHTWQARSPQQRFTSPTESARSLPSEARSRAPERTHRKLHRCTDSSDEVRDLQSQRIPPRRG